MSKIYKSASELIGRTPLVEAVRLEQKLALSARILLKLGCFNLSGSVKDRIAKAMIEDAEKSGILKPGDTIIEPTSGNMGIGLASIAASKGYRIILTMPETTSVERRNLLKAYGAEVIVTDGKRGMRGAIAKAKELSWKIKGSFIPDQFSNPANPETHRKTTGPEIWDDTDGEIDIFVAGVGTGGTISGVGEYLKSKKPSIQVVAVEPAASPLLSEGRSGPHDIQGIGAGFIPENLNTQIYDEIITVTDEDAVETSRQLGRIEGIQPGISSGAALWAAIELAKRPENTGKMIVAVMPDSGDRYFGTSLYQK